MDVVDVLEKALDVLDERGWHQGELRGPGGSVCAFGAIHEACQRDVRQYATARWVVEKTLMKHLGDNGTYSSPSVSQWNDDPERTEEDVKMLFKECIHELRSQRDD